MSLFFPAYIEDEENIEDLEEETASPKDYGIDFETGQLTGEIVEGLEAVKVWIWLALQVPRYRHYIYTWDYGGEYDGVIGQAYTEEYLEAEAYHLTEDCLMVNENIEGISDFNIKIESSTLYVSFTAETLYGNIDINNLALPGKQGVS
ncbi:MAG: DUF2634 domain-containing protein [Lachnospiraceae bacterium]|nr:DUF2634 domain-containing protein [Lachnospiraceae bacterium]